MIARLTILLPFTLSIPVDEGLTPFEFRKENYSIKIYPPFQSNIDLSSLIPTSSTPITDVGNQLTPRSPQIPIQEILVDEKATIQADLLQIDFFKKTFDRKKGSITNEPLEDFMLSVVNDFILKTRTVTQAAKIKLLNKKSLWRLNYLTDEGKELLHDPVLIRKRFSVSFSWSVIAINEKTWEKIKKMPSKYEPPTWETLILDAESLLPQIGPTLVLTAASLETLISFTLDSLVKSGKKIPNDFWEWVKNRENWLQEPTVAEQFDKLLFLLTGRSLKNKKRLWEAFINLKKARNSFVHEGTAVIEGKEVDEALTIKLLNEAKEIINWVEEVLPENLKRKLLKQNLKFTFIRNISPL